MHVYAQVEGLEMRARLDAYLSDEKQTGLLTPDVVTNLALLLAYLKIAALKYL